VKDQLREKLNHNAVMAQLPIGLEHELVGVVDLVAMRAHYNEGENGEVIREAEIPADMMDAALAAREDLLDVASMFSDELTELILEEEEISVEVFRAAIRMGTLARKMTPVFCGSAFKNKGVQMLLDAVTYFLPNPMDVENIALDLDEDEKEVILPSDRDKPFIGLACKLEEGRYGQLTYLRIYQGSLTKGDTIFNVRDTKKIKVGRLVRMHSNNMQDIDATEAGDIVALFGVDCRSGDTFTDGDLNYAMSSMHVPAPVIHYTIVTKDAKSTQNLSKALQRFTKEDPTFRAGNDPETGETIISGMGELHLDVYIERMRREYGVPIEVSPPRVAYRETLTIKADFDYTHKKQTGGSGQYGRVCGFVEPNDDAEYHFVDQIKGGVIPREFISSCDKGFRSQMEKGRLIGQPVTGVSVTINFGSSHAVDSSDVAFQEAARGAWREVYARANPVILEPVMKVEIEGPTEFHGQIVGTIMQRRGLVLGTQEDAGFTRVESEVPLSEMFGYSTVLRSNTQGKAEFSMEFSRYDKVPNNVANDLIADYQESRK
jgi:elongation factor G